MWSNIGPSLVRAAAVIPAFLLVLFVGLLWLLGLPCDEKRREYVVNISDQAMRALGAMFYGYFDWSVLSRPDAKQLAELARGEGRSRKMGNACSSSEVSSGEHVDDAIESLVKR